ncbi:MAG: sulfate permease [Dermatophilaceae bacterium]
MLCLLWALSIRIHYFLRCYMPTNILLDLIRTRRSLKWGVPAMLLAAPYLFAASICTNLISDGGPGWLNLLVLLFIWDAMKFAIMGPISLILLVRVRIREAAARRHAHRQHSVAEGATADMTYAGAGVTR